MNDLLTDTSADNTAVHHNKVPQARSKFLTLRSAIIGIVGVALLCAITPYNDFYLHQTYLYGNHFPVGSLFFFLILVLVINTLLRRFRKLWALSQPELLTIWAMLTTGCGLASSGLMRYLGPLPVAPFYYANETNGWSAWNRYIPGWMVPSHDPKSPVVQWFFEGVPQGGHIPWQPWVHVFFYWGIALFLVVGLSLFVCVLTRKQWVEREKLVFPLVHIPIEMTKEPETGLVNSFFRNRLMWLGVVISVTIHGINGLHSYYYSVPTIPMSVQTWQWFPNAPWSSLSIWSVQVYTSAIGIGYLLPSEVSFSIWSFFLMFKFLRVARVAMGLPSVTGALPNHESALTIGGYLVWGIWLLWVSRQHIGSIIRSFVHPTPKEDADEPVPLRIAAMGAVICFIGIVLWTTVAGVNPVFSLLLWSFFIWILIMLTRIIAESGMLMVQTVFAPTDSIAAVPGSTVFNPSGLGQAIMVQTVFMHDPREAYMPAVMNSMRLKGNDSGRGIIWGILLATIVGFVVSYISLIFISYKYGAVNLDPWGDRVAPIVYYGRIGDYIKHPTGIEWSAAGNMAIGGGICMLLIAMRANYLWWPLQPIGLVLAPSYAVNCLWFSILLAWMFKRLAMIGGYKTYRTFLPLFLGLALGDAVIAGVWVIVGMITGTGVPYFLPA